MKAFVNFIIVYLFITFTSSWAIVPVNPFPADGSVMKYENWFAWEISDSDTANWHKYRYKFELYDDSNVLLAWDLVDHGPIKPNAYPNLPPGIKHPPFINPAFSNVGKIKLSQGNYKWHVGIVTKNFIVWGPWWYFQVKNQPSYTFINLHLFSQEKFIFCQNYPNPFNPVTTIKYDLPQAVQVELNVYNISGQKVATLVNEKQPAGEYAIKFNASNLPSGTYIYQLKAGNSTQTKKMILLK